MENEELFKLLAGQNSFRLDSGLKLKLSEMIKRESYPKSQLILRPGQISNRVWFIEKGSALGFVYKEEKKIPLWFWDENDIVLSLHSFFSQVSSETYIELLEPSVLLSISYEEVLELIKTYPETNGYIRKIMDEHQHTSENRVLRFASLTPQEHYLYLIKNKPAIFRKVSVENIAAYLGISRKTLNRIRTRTRRM